MLGWGFGGVGREGEEEGEEEQAHGVSGSFFGDCTFPHAGFGVDRVGRAGWVGGVAGPSAA